VAQEDAGGGPDIVQADSVLIGYHLRVFASVQHVGHVPDPSATALEDGLPERYSRPNCSASRFSAGRIRATRTPAARSASSTYASAIAMNVTWASRRPPGVDDMKQWIAVRVTKRPAKRRTRDAEEPGGVTHIQQSRAEPRVVHLTYLPRPNSYTPLAFWDGGSSGQPDAGSDHGACCLG
jgi:hypothetical protein